MSLLRSLVPAIAALLVSFVLAPIHVGAQENGLLAITVRGADESLLTDVRVRVMAPGIDTLIRTNGLGAVSVLLPRGTVRLTLTRIGYEAETGEVQLEQATAVTVRMRALPQTLQAFAVRDNWIGIRGVIGDDSTMTPLRNVTITSMKQSIRVQTDSVGRFEFALPKAERTTLRVEVPGYSTRPVVVTFDRGKTSADIVVLLKRGNDLPYMKFAMSDLERRVAWGGIGMMTLDRAELSKTGARYLDEALRDSPERVRKGVGTHGCVFVDGQPMPSKMIYTIPVARIELVEYWGVNAEGTKTLAARWPGRNCSIQGDGKGVNGPWISVWMRR